MRITQESPATLRRRLARIDRLAKAVRGRQTRALRRQPAAGGLHRQTLPQPRPELPRPDPGREHRPDAGGRQVRVRPRLQVLHLRHLVDSPGDHPGHRRPQPHDPRAGPHDREHGPGAQRHPPTVPRARRRADAGGDRRGRRALGRGDRVRAADDPAAALARPAGGRPRRHLLRRVPRKTTARTTRCWR